MEYAVPFKEAMVNALMCKQPVAGSNVVEAGAERVYAFSVEEFIGNALGFVVGGIAADYLKMKKEA